MRIESQKINKRCGPVLTHVDGAIMSTVTNERETVLRAYGLDGRLYSVVLSADEIAHAMRRITARQEIEAARELGYRS